MQVSRTERSRRGIGIALACAPTSGRPTVCQSPANHTSGRFTGLYVHSPAIYLKSRHGAKEFHSSIPLQTVHLFPKEAIRWPRRPSTHPEAYFIGVFHWRVLPRDRSQKDSVNLWGTIHTRVLKKWYAEKFLEIQNSPSEKDRCERHSP